MKEHICPDCGYEAASPANLQKHLDKKNKCTQGNHHCEVCKFRTNNKNSFYNHRKSCKGGLVTKADLEKENNDLKTVLAATGNQRSGAGLANQVAPTTSNTIGQNHSGSGDIVGHDQINNITNNIYVNNTFGENTDHIKRMTIEELKAEIGCLSDISTHVKLFDLIRTTGDHPENNTMLLPEENGKTCHFKTEEGWKSGPYQQKMFEAFFKDNALLVENVPKSMQDEEFYSSYLLGCNFKTGKDLMPYYQACRKSLHALTMRLAEAHSNFRRSDAASEFTSLISSSSSQAISSTLSFQQQKELQEMKKMELKMAKEIAEMRIQEKELEYKILMAKQQTST